jgi:DUF4097 and DUF4098 domain-containing protein YvlB
MKSMKLLHAAILVSFLCLTGPAKSYESDPAGASPGQSERTIDRELQANPGQRLSLDLNTGGDVKISGWQNNIVSIKAYMGGRDWRDCAVDINQTSDQIMVTSRHTGGRNSYSTDFKFEIQVPERFDVRIKSAGGAIAITNLDGEVSGGTGGGELNITEAKGKLNLRTGGGDITVTRSELDGRVSTGGGHVIIQDVKGDFAGTSGGGPVELRNVTRPSGASTGDEVRISNAGGDIAVDDAPAGAEVKTGGGNIHIKSARAFIKATTGGGNIQVDAVDGSVHATTGAGRISVHVAGPSSEGNHDVYITSGSGDINLTVPRDFSMDLELKLGYTRTDKQYRIISSFEITRESTDEWSSAEGTPRKYLYGRASIAGGRNRIHIETVNGNINVQAQR